MFSVNKATAKRFRTSFMITMISAGLKTGDMSDRSVVFKSVHGLPGSIHP